MVIGNEINVGIKYFVSRQNNNWFQNFSLVTLEGIWDTKTSVQNTEEM